MAEPLLRVDNLKTYFDTPRGTAKAVDGVSFTVAQGETLALVGESGCGKSMTALSLLQLVPEPAGYIAGGHVYFQGVDLLDYTWEQMRKVRGVDIGMIFQEPMTSLNPVFTVGWQLIETMAVHGKGRGPDVQKRAIELLDRVGLEGPERILRQYPHELSGGMRQRVMIAMALANDPKLLIADEPTTALDVTVQKQILELIRDLQQDFGMAVLLITHDLGIVAEMSDDVAVMYAGQIVEYAPTRELFRDPQHPYTKALFASRPSREQRGQNLVTIEGIVPQATNWPPACRFAPRCPYRWDTCTQIAPKYLATASGGSMLEQTALTDNVSVEQAMPGERRVRCHLYDPELSKTRTEEDKTPVEVAS